MDFVITVDGETWDLLSDAAQWADGDRVSITWPGGSVFTSTVKADGPTLVTAELSIPVRLSDGTVPDMGNATSIVVYRRRVPLAEPTVRGTVVEFDVHLAVRTEEDPTSPWECFTCGRLDSWGDLVQTHGRPERYTTEVVWKECS